MIRNSFVEAFNYIKQMDSIKENKIKQQITESMQKHQDMVDKIYNIRESREMKLRNHSKLIEDCKNDALSTIIKAIYIEALEPASLTDNALILAESLVDSWIKSKGGASRIIAENRNKTYLLNRICTIAEEAAFMEVDEIEALEKEESEETATPDTNEEVRKSKVSELMAKAQELIAKANAIQNGADIEEEKTDDVETDDTVEDTTTDNTDVEDTADSVSADDLSSSDSTEGSEETSDTEETESEDIETTEDNEGSEEVEDTEEITDTEDSEGNEEIEDTETEEIDNGDESEEIEDTETEEIDSDNEEVEDTDTEEEVDTDEESDDLESVDTEADDTEEVVDDDTEEVEDTDDTDSEDLDDTEDGVDDSDSEDEEDLDDADTETDSDEDIEDDGNVDGSDIVDTDEEPKTIDGEEDDGTPASKGKIFDELEDEEDVKKAVEIISQRVADAEEDFVKRNAEDKKKIDDLIGKISDNIKTVEKISNNDDPKSKVAEESVRMYNRQIKNITENRPMKVFEKMVRKLSESTVKDKVLKEAYTLENGRLDIGGIIESAKVMYGFLEALNTLQFERVDKDYIENVIKEL